MTESLFKRTFFSIYSYAVIYSLFGVLSLSYHACFNSSLGTLEKRYHFSSSTGGLIMITDNIATILTTLVIGHYGKTAHKPRWMSIGCVVTGISVMVTALPYFIYGPAQEVDLEFAKNVTLSTNSKNGDQMCLLRPNPEDCSADTAEDRYSMTMVAVACFAISNFFRGFGTSIYFTYGAPYLDDNVSKAKMPTFFAFIFAARILGAPIGYYLSSLALKYYENPFSVPRGLDPTDPRWIGAWWIGFLVSGFLMLILAIPLSFFPREFRKSKKTISELANAEELRQLDEATEASSKKVNGELTQISLKVDNANSMQQQSDKSNATIEGSKLKDLPREIYQILTNPIVACQMMGNLFRGIGLIGYFVFQTKYLEAQFRQSASKASLVSGTTGFLAKIFGVLFGGFVISLCRPKARVLTTFIFFVELTSVFTLLYGASVMGPQYIYPHTELNANNQMEVMNRCNRDCFCEHLRYQPVCEHKDMKAYFSPCHAGCKNSYKTQDGGSLFTECSCIDNPSKTVERCPPDTDNLFKYAYIVAIGGMVSGSSRPGNMVTFFRSITPEQKSLAVAVGSWWHSLFVAIPYPLIYGKIFDYCCLVWSKECNKRGNCWLYDTEKLRYVYHGVSIALIAMGSVFDFIMIFLSPRLTNLYDEEETEKSNFKDRLMFWKKKQANLARTENSNSSEQHRLSVTVEPAWSPGAEKPSPPEQEASVVEPMQITKL